MMSRTPIEPDDRDSAWKRHAPPVAMAVMGVLAAASLTFQSGFPVGADLVPWFVGLDILLAVGFGVALLVELAAARRRHEKVRQRLVELLTLGGFVAALLLIQLPEEATLARWATVFHQHSTLGVSIGVVKLFLLANVCVQILRSLQRVFVAGVRLELLLAGSFAGLIAIGTLLLLMPHSAARPDAPISLLDAFFTSTSAVCVTGLAVRDTGADFSTLGQMLVLALFQIGGLGIVTFVAFISAYSAKTLPVPQMVAFRQVVNAPAMDDLKRRIAGILILTAIVESAGAACLYAFVARGGDAFEHLKWAVFHSVSAFCNAGFALQGDSLEFARTHVAANTTIMLLIVLGGLGFLVLPELIGILVRSPQWLPLSLRRKADRFGRALPPRLTVQTRISLRVTAGLVVAGLFGFWWLERAHLLSGATAGDAFLISAFQSITARTAGFNTVPIGDLQPPTLILMTGLMVIGGCPVSTAGGIKTVTFGILLLALRSMVFQRENVEAFGRTLPPRAFFTALNVSVLYAVTAAGGVFLLAVFDPQVALRDTMFETVSALSTVGLSTGITAGLSVGSKLVLCAAMFVGRVGPIALILSVFQARGKVDYEFPTEDVVVG